MPYDYLAERFRSAVAQAFDITEVPLEFSRPKNPDFGDISTNVALRLAKTLGKSPRAIADAIWPRLDLDDAIVALVAIEGPGFINLTLAPAFLRDTLRGVIGDPKNYGRCDIGNGEKVLVEYVSANPTGPLGVVNGRAAAVGSAVVNLLNYSGHAADSEFYLNDAGNQVARLGGSLRSRIGEVLGRDLGPIPAEGYPGDYVLDLAKEAVTALPDWETMSDAELGTWTAGRIGHEFQETLNQFGTPISDDHYISERQTIQSQGLAQTTLAHLESLGTAYRADGAVFLRMPEDSGDEHDRVLVKSDGSPTYFLNDLAYHRDKLARGYTRLINYWGPDHHGQIPRMMVGMEALGHPGVLQVEIIQWVTLVSEGQEVAMSKRAGKIYELADLIEDVGTDVARFFFLMRRNNSHLAFDLDLARKQSDENPVYYVQYAHARICSILRSAIEQGHAAPNAETDLSPLMEMEELNLMRQMWLFREMVRGAALALEPHRLTVYLQELAACYHLFYQRHRVIVDEEPLRLARLALCQGVAAVLAKGLDLLGISAPERM